MFDRMKARFLAEHPEHAHLKDEELIVAMEKHQAFRDEMQRKKMREHLEVFSDAVIAIVITIMVLEIEFPSAETPYIKFMSNIGIFLVSFFIIASFWLDHHRIFAENEKISLRVLVLDFCFLAGLSLIPIMTKWMMLEPEKVAVINYGLVYMICKIFLQLVHHFSRMENREDLEKETLDKLQRFSMLQFILVIVLNSIIMLIAYFHTNIGHWYYCGLPIASFVMSLFTPKSKQIRELYEMSKKR